MAGSLWVLDQEGGTASPINKAGTITLFHRSRNLLSLCLNHKCQVRVCFIWGRRQETPPSHHRQNMGEPRPQSHNAGLWADSSSGALTTSPGNLAQDSGLLVRMLSQLLSHKLLSWGAAASLAGPQALTHLGPRWRREVQEHTGDIQLRWLSSVTCPPPGRSAGAQANLLLLVVIPLDV